jgi:hypothetical protein
MICDMTRKLGKGRKTECELKMWGERRLDLLAVCGATNQQEHSTHTELSPEGSSTTTPKSNPKHQPASEIGASASGMENVWRKELCWRVGGRTHKRVSRGAHTQPSAPINKNEQTRAAAAAPPVPPNNQANLGVCVRRRVLLLLSIL